MFRNGASIPPAAHWSLTPRVLPPADVKPENIMCQTSKSTNVKLIDFGLATKLNPNELVKISTGTAEFAAPEIVEREPVGFYTDMWAVGVLAYVL